MKSLILRYGYTLLFYFMMPFVFLRLFWRSLRRSKAYRQRWPERLGFCPYRLEQSIWIHAVSVGETIAAIPLIKALQARYPALPIVVTNMTITGAACARAACDSSVLQSYVPYDLPDMIERFLQRTRPLVAIIMETELWPNTFAACQRRGIPLIVANARLSEKSAKGYQRFASLTQSMLKAVHTLAVQTAIEADRFIALGLSADRAVVTGNIKFDLEIPADLMEKSAALRAVLGSQRLIWIAASTHAGEEDILLAAHQQLLASFPDALLIIVPRHPERFDAVFALAERQGLSVVRRSQPSTAMTAAQVYVGDTMGELLLLYAVSDVAFVGGSLVAMGGHNMLEASVLGKPVVTGVHLFNFAEISRSLIAARGMQQVKNGDELVAVLQHLLSNADQRRVMGEYGQRFVTANRGALVKQVALVAAVIDAAR